MLVLVHDKSSDYQRLNSKESQRQLSERLERSERRSWSSAPGSSSQGNTLDRLAGRIVGWSNCWLVGSLVGWIVGWLDLFIVGWLFDRALKGTPRIDWLV